MNSHGKTTKPYRKKKSEKHPTMNIPGPVVVDAGCGWMSAGCGYGGESAATSMRCFGLRKK
jgi:hypothetical protein